MKESPNMSSSTNTENEINSVSAAVERLREAMLSGSADDLNAIAADDLVYIHSNGRPETKTEFIDAFVSGNSVFESIDLKNQNIKVSGDNAVVWHLLEGKTNNRGVAGSVSIGIMLVWQKQNGEWKLLARQAQKY